MESVKGKNILIVGATGGIGSKTAKLLAGNGANIFLAGRNQEKLDIVAKELGISSDKTFALDISIPEQVQALKENYFAVFPNLDILVNADSIGIIKPIEHLSGDEFLSTLN